MASVIELILVTAYSGRQVFVGAKKRRSYIYLPCMNQNPEQLSRDEIDRQLMAAGWVIQNKGSFNLVTAHLKYINKKPELYVRKDTLSFNCGKHGK